VEHEGRVISEGAERPMKRCDEILRKTLALTDAMSEIADEGDSAREDVGCGVLYGVLRDTAYKIRKLAEEERDAHIRKGWWKQHEGATKDPGS